MISVKLNPEALVMISGSSAGTQPKYYDNGFWYKTNQNGYEGTSEYLASLVLSCSNVSDFVRYELCKINGRPGCRSKNFLKETEAYISFQRLYDIYDGGSLLERVMPMKTVDERISFVLSYIFERTGIDCGDYLSKILSLDCLLLNTDRHFHNLGIILDRETNTGHPAPIFDNGDALLSNYNKFPADEPVGDLIDRTYSQPFSSSFESQAAAAGLTLQIDYEKLLALLENEPSSRATTVLKHQLDKYRFWYAR